MNSKFLLAAGCVLATTLGSASGAWAQAAAAAPAVTHGPPIQGVCIFSAEGAIATSTVGKYVNTRMQQIVAQVNAELNGQKTTLENEAKTLEAQSKTLDQAALQTKVNDLNTKGQALQRLAAQREREISATEQKAYSRVATELEPLARQAYQSKQCSILLNGGAVSIANPAMDITPQVITALNAKITQFQIDRERLDQAAAAGQAAAPAAKK